MKSMVCLGDCLIFAKCIVFCVHWLTACQTPMLTVANKAQIFAFQITRRGQISCNSISRAPTKAKSQEPASSQALNQNKIDRQWSRSRESGSQMVMVDGVWS